MRKLLYLFISSCFALMVSCMNDEDYTISAADKLRFSTDTVKFDTIISGSPTNTYTFTVYNPANKAIRIPQVKLESGAASPFKVNVDGTPLVNGAAMDFEIASKDSLIVLLMANLPESEAIEPIPSSDNLVFITEAGVEQKVALSASGITVTPLSGMRISENTTFHSPRPYRVMDSLVVDAGCTLTLAAGTQILFHPKATLTVHGTLRVEGTAESPVMLRGDRMGYMFDGQPYDRIPGQWGGIVLTKSSYGNYINHADIHSSNWGLRADSSDIGREKLRLENSIIHNTQNHGLDLRMANAYIGNCQLTNAGGNCVQVTGGDVQIVHCTIARFYIFSGGNGTALNFRNYDGSIRMPLKRLEVVNSIITGYSSDELLGGRNAEHEHDAFNYTFSHCLINTPRPEKEDAKMRNCYWDYNDGTTSEGDTLVTRDENFVPKPDLEALTFSFELSPHSKAIGHADATVTAATYPNDAKGRSRGSKPDMGCYQHPNNNEHGSKKNKPLD